MIQNTPKFSIVQLPFLVSKALVGYVHRRSLAKYFLAVSLWPKAAETDLVHVSFRVEHAELEYYAAHFKAICTTTVQKFA